jgi:hypothetical protein
LFLLLIFAPFKPASSSDNLPEEVPDATLHVKAVHEDNDPCPYPWGTETLLLPLVQEALMEWSTLHQGTEQQQGLFAKFTQDNISAYANQRSRLQIRARPQIDRHAICDRLGHNDGVQPLEISIPRLPQVKEVWRGDLITILLAVTRHTAPNQFYVPVRSLERRQITRWLEGTLRFLLA